MKSLEKQFALGQVISLLLVFAVLTALSVTAIQSMSERYIHTRLEHDAEALLAALWQNPRDMTVLREGRITPVYLQPLSGHYFQFDFADGQQIRSRSLWEERLPVEKVPAGDVLHHEVQGPSGQWLLLRSAGYRKHDRDFTLTVAEDSLPMQEDIRHFEKMALVVFALLLLMVMAVQRLLLRRGFGVLEAVADELKQIAAGQRREISEPGPVEIRPLTREINRLLEQLQKRLRRSREAMGNLAHALKGPLSLVMQDIDKLPLEDAQRNDISRHLDSIHKQIERELKKARIAGGVTGRHFNTQQALSDLIEVLQRLYAERSLQVITDNQIDGEVPFDHEDMMELLGNLLDNAFKWAHSSVQVRVWQRAGQLQMTIEDDGPGIQPDDRDALLQRGQRLDEQTPGHGLGLAIVTDLVADYAGSVRLETPDGGKGLVVRVSLPVTQ